MSETPYKIVATLENFASAVVDASATKPVLVDFWAPWCGPCRTLMPMLDRLADDYGGRFLLAKVNTDEQQQIAGHFGIRSIPTVMLFHQGQAVEQFVGVQPEQAIRALLDKYVAPSEAGPPERARQLARQGDFAGAELLLEGALAERPDDAALLVELANLQLAARNAAAAAATLDRIAALAPDSKLLGPLRARLGFVEAVAARPDAAALRAALERDPADSAARHALAAHHALAGDFATALSEWLELMRRDRRFGDDLARRSLLGAFDALGEGHELVASYRRKLASLLH